jgi:tetratricopeptide (TPR) repeat protein
MSPFVSRTLPATHRFLLALAFAIVAGTVCWRVSVPRLASAADESGPTKSGPTERDPTERDPIDPGLSDPAGAPWQDLPAILPDSRTEDELDRVEALALMAHGALLSQRQRFLPALRRYQRAWRSDPDVVDVLRDIVPLAFSLNRAEEATRYAVLAVEQHSRDGRLLEQLGDYLAAKGELDRAIRLYERALAIARQADKAVSIQVQLKLGRAAFLTGEFQRAAVAFDSVRQALDAPEKFGLDDSQIEDLLDESGPTYTLFGETFLRAERLDDAVAMFRRAAREDNQPSLLLYQQARVEAERKNWAKAGELLEQYWRQPLETTTTEPYELLALVMSNTRETAEQARAETIARLRSLVERQPDNVALVDYLARLIVVAGDSDEALRLYESSLEKNSDDGTLLAGLAAVCLHKQDDAQLLNVLGRLMLADESVRSLGDELTGLTKDAERLKRLLGKARQWAEKDTLPTGAALAVAQIALLGEQFDAAERFFELARKEESPGSGEVLTVWGLGMFMAQQYERAAEVFRKAIQDDALADEAAQLYYYLAGSLALSDQNDEAIRAAKRAVALEPDSVDYHGRIAWIHYQAEQDAKAEAAYRELLERFDDRTDAATREVLREARLVLSNLCVRGQRFEEGVEWLQQVLDEFPEDIGAKNDLGYLWADSQQHLRRALRMIQEAVAGDPENVAYRDSLGWAYHRLGQNEKALRELQLAAQGPDIDGVILDHLGDIHWQLGQFDEARSAWRRAVDAFRRDAQPDKQPPIDAKLRRQDDKIE